MNYEFGKKKRVFVDWDFIEPGHGLAWGGDGPASWEMPYGIKLAVHSPRIDWKPLVKPDQPWEHDVECHHSMFEDDGKYRLYYRIWDARSKLNGALSSIINGIRVVKAFGQETREVDRFNRTSSYLRDSFRRVEHITATFQPGMAILVQVGGILVWFFGGRLVLDDGMTLGKLTAFLGYLAMFYVPLRQLTSLTNWLTSFLSSAQRTFEIIDTQPLILESKDTRSIPAASAASIKFDNVRFGYDRDESVINDLSFEVCAGEHLGVVGKSGSGKTTLINLIARFYDVSEGAVSVNGIDVRRLSLPELRRFVGVVLQESFLFRGTIYEKLTYGNPDVNFDQVVEAAKAANAHEFILRKQFGYDTYIGERGACLLYTSDAADE